MELLGDRIALREHVIDDWSTLAEYQADRRYLEFYPPEVDVPERTKALVDRFVAWATEQPRANYQFGIVDRATGRLIGSCGLRTAGMAAGCAEFGLELSPDWWGRGLAAESARAVLRFGFETLALEQVRGVSVTQNVRIVRLVRRLGFVEGATRADDEWMRARGWTLTEWVLTKDVWARGARGGPVPERGRPRAH